MAFVVGFGLLRPKYQIRFFQRVSYIVQKNYNKSFLKQNLFKFFIVPCGVPTNSEMYADFRSEGILQNRCTGKKLHSKNRFSGGLGVFFVGKHFWSHIFFKYVKVPLRYYIITAK